MILLKFPLSKRVADGSHGTYYQYITPWNIYEIYHFSHEHIRKLFILRTYHKIIPSQNISKIHFYLEHIRKITSSSTYLNIAETNFCPGHKNSVLSITYKKINSSQNIIKTHFSLDLHQKLITSVLSRTYKKIISTQNISQLISTQNK